MDTPAAEPSSYSTFDTLCGVVFGTPGPGAKSPLARDQVNGPVFSAEARIIRA